MNLKSWILLLATVLFGVSAPTGAGADEEIVLGMSAAFSGPTRGLGIELQRGAQAYFAHVNQSGGIHGRPIVIRALDDRYTPGPAIENTLDFIGQDDLFALFGFVGTPTTTRVIPLLRRYKDKDITLLFPLTGAEPLRRPPYSKWIFNLRASYFDETQGLVENFVRQGRLRIAVFHQADAFGRSGWDGVRKALAKYDMTITAEATYKRGAPFKEDMSAQVDVINRRNPDAVIAVGAASACAAFIRDARDKGLSVPIATLSFANAEHLLHLLGSLGQGQGNDYTRDLVSSQVVPSYEDLDLPAVTEYRRIMAQYAPLPDNPEDNAYLPQRYSFVSFEGFLNAKLMTECLRRMGPTPKRADIPGAIESIGSFDLGIGEPVSFGPSKHQALSRVYFTTVDKGRFVPLADFRRWRK